MKILGEMIVGERAFRGTGSELYALVAQNGERLLPSFGAGTLADIDAACELADTAFDSYRELPDSQRATFLEQIADKLIALDDTLIERAHMESGLPVQHLL